MLLHPERALPVRELARVAQPSPGSLHRALRTLAELVLLLAAVERNLHDAAQTGISDKTRFDAAYKAVMQCAPPAMPAQGDRPPPASRGTM